MKTFNQHVLDVIATYPRDGSYTYSWTEEENYVGCTKDLYYRGEQFVIGDPEKRSYCSGITFEVFFQAYQSYNRERGFDKIGDLNDASEMNDFRLKWYGTGGDRRTIKHALLSSKLGYEITDLSQVAKGDFVQIWRHNDSGHTVVFIDWIKDESQTRIGLKYWSSNKKTGPDYQIEYFGTEGKTIDWQETFFMKVKEI